jgi:hypothetical protein
MSENDNKNNILAKIFLLENLTTKVAILDATKNEGGEINE